MSRGGGGGGASPAVTRWDPSLQRCLHIDTTGDYEACTGKGPEMAYFDCPRGLVTDKPRADQALDRAACELYENRTEQALIKENHRRSNATGDPVLPITSQGFLRCMWEATGPCKDEKACAARGSCNDHSFGRPGGLSEEARGGACVHDSLPPASSSSASASSPSPAPSFSPGASHPFWNWYDGGHLVGLGALAANGSTYCNSTTERWKRAATTNEQCTTVGHGSSCVIADPQEPWKQRRTDKTRSMPRLDCKLCGHTKWQPFNAWQPATFAPATSQRFKWTRLGLTGVNTWHDGNTLNGTGKAFNFPRLDALVQESVRRMFVSDWEQEIRCNFEGQLAMLRLLACACGAGRPAAGVAPESLEAATLRCDPGNFQTEPAATVAGTAATAATAGTAATGAATASSGSGGGGGEQHGGAIANERVPLSLRAAAAVLLLGGNERATMESLFTRADMVLRAATPTASAEATTGVKVELQEVPYMQYEVDPATEPWERYSTEHAANLTAVTRPALTYFATDPRVSSLTWVRQVETEQVLAYFAKRCFQQEAIRNRAGVVVGQIIGNGAMVRVSSAGFATYTGIQQSSTSSVTDDPLPDPWLSGDPLFPPASAGPAKAAVEATVCVFPSPEVDICTEKYDTRDFAVADRARGGTPTLMTTLVPAGVPVAVQADGRWCSRMRLGIGEQATVFPILRKARTEPELKCQRQQAEWLVHDCGQSTEGYIIAEPTLVRLCRPDCVARAVRFLADAWLFNCTWMRATATEFVERYDRHCFEERAAVDEQWHPPRPCMAAAQQIIYAESKFLDANAGDEAVVCSSACSEQAQMMHAKAVLAEPQMAYLELSTEQFLVVQARRCGPVRASHNVTARLMVSGYPSATFADRGQTEPPLALRMAFARLLDVPLPALVITYVAGGGSGTAAGGSGAAGSSAAGADGLARFTPALDNYLAVPGAHYTYTSATRADLVEEYYTQLYDQQCQTFAARSELLPPLQALVGAPDLTKTAFLDIEAVFRSQQAADTAAMRLRNISLDAGAQSEAVENIRKFGARDVSAVVATGMFIEKIRDPPPPGEPLDPGIEWMPITPQAGKAGPGRGTG
eukprot:g5273.t1